MDERVAQEASPVDSLHREMEESEAVLVVLSE
jgi:hypothetical protein